MQAGLLFACERLKIRAVATGVSQSRQSTADGTNVVVVTESFWAPNNTALLTGIRLSGTSEQVVGSATERRVYQVTIPSIGFTFSKTVAGIGALDTHLEIDNFKPYSTGAGWITKGSAVRWYVDGVLEQSAGAFSVTGSYYPAASGIPLWGIPPLVTGSALDSHEVYLTCAPGPSSGAGGSFSHGAFGTCSGGWEFLVSGVWYQPNVNLLTQTPPLLGCSMCSEEVGNIVSCTNTNNVTISAYSHTSLTIDSDTEIDCFCQPPGCPEQGSKRIRYRTGEGLTRDYSGTVCTLPDLPKSYKIFNTASLNDYSEMIIKYGFPKTTDTATATCTINGGQPVQQTNTVERHPRQSQVKSVIGNAAHPIDDTLGFSTYAPYGVSFEKCVNRTPSRELIFDTLACARPPCALGDSCDPYTANADFCSYIASSGGFGVDRLVDNPQMYAVYDHADPTARYINYTANPHFSYFTDFEDWDLFGAPADKDLYWKVIREQWQYNASLPPAEQKRTRNTLLSQPLLTNPMPHFRGICRFQPQNPTVPASVTLTSASSPGWTFTGCTGAFGASGITLTPSTTNIVAEYDIGSWSEYPYMVPHLANAYKLQWSPTNITSANVYLVNQQGKKQLISQASSATAVAFPNSTDDHYAGSYGQDFGVGYTVDDIGYDTDAAGISLDTLYSSIETNAAFQLLGGRTAAKLRFEIAVTNPALTCFINYPEFVLPTIDGTVIPETGTTQALVFSNGSGLRIGQWDWYDSGLLTSPIMYAIGQKSTGLDYLTTKRVLFEARAYNDALTTEMAALYDSTEGQTAADLSTNTMFFLAPTGKVGRGILVNSLAEVPPLAQLPRFARNPTTFVEDPNLGFAQESWSYSVEPRYIVSARQSTFIFNFDFSELWSEASPYNLIRWPVQQIKHIVDNNEGVNFWAWNGAQLLGLMSPWHGYFIVSGLNLPGEINPYNIQTERGHYHRAAILDGDVTYKSSQFTVPLPSWNVLTTVTSTGDCSFPRMAEDYRNRIYLLYTRLVAGNYQGYERFSDDYGRTWSSEAAMAITGPKWNHIWSGHDGSVLRTGFVYLVPSSGPGNIKATYQGPGDLSQSAVFTFKDETGTDMIFADDSFGASLAWDGARRWLLTCVIDGEGSSSDWQSWDNARTWKRIS